MYRLALVALVASSVTSSVPGTPVGTALEQAAAQDTVSRTLMRLENEWCRALVRRDGATFERLLAQGFVYTEDDRLIERDALLRDIVTSTDTVTAARNEAMRVHHFGLTAVVTGWLIVQGRGASGRFDRRYRYTDTWVNQGGSWRIAAAHDYLMPAGRPIGAA